MKKTLMSLIIFATLALCGCKTVNPATGVREFDPVKTSAVKAIVEPIISGGVRRAIQNSPAHSEQIAVYFRAVAGAFCAASDNKALDPIYIVDAVDAATAGKQNGVDPYLLDVKNAVIAAYKVAYGDRFRAELSPEKWPANVAEVICNSINQALTDSGFQAYDFEPTPSPQLALDLPDGILSR